MEVSQKKGSLHWLEPIFLFKYLHFVKNFTYTGWILRASFFVNIYSYEGCPKESLQPQKNYQTN